MRCRPLRGVTAAAAGHRHVRAASRSAQSCQGELLPSTDTPRVAPPLRALPSRRIGIPLVPLRADRAQRGLHQLPAPLILERVLDCSRDEGTAAPRAYTLVEFADKFIRQCNVYTHGHKIAHSTVSDHTLLPRARIYRRCRAAGVTPRGMVDCMIAAVAKRHRATLLAHDADLAHVAAVIAVALDTASLRP